MTKRNVFICSSQEGLALARELEQQLETTANTTLWTEAAFHPGKTVAESLSEAAERSDFAVFVLTPDDKSAYRSGASPRPNLLFELGFLAGRLGLSRIFIVVPDSGSMPLPSDLAGVMCTSMPVSQGKSLAAAVAPAAAAIRRTIGEMQPRQDRPIEYYSCFISYSWSDQNFAARLHDDLREVGIRSWLDEKEMRVGGRILDQIDRAIQVHDKVLLVLSHASVQSSWVRWEVSQALRLERERQRTMLFPLRLDRAVLEISGIEEIERLRERYIVDFSEWQEERGYQRAFSHLVRDLTISASVESGRQP